MNIFGQSELGGVTFINYWSSCPGGVADGLGGKRSAQNVFRYDKQNRNQQGLKCCIDWISYSKH